MHEDFLDCKVCGEDLNEFLRELAVRLRLLRIQVTQLDSIQEENKQTAFVMHWKRLTLERRQADRVDLSVLVLHALRL